MLAESKGGIRATRHPLENIVNAMKLTAPPPELLQKFYASQRFVGRTPVDDQFVREGLGYY